MLHIVANWSQFIDVAIGHTDSLQAAYEFIVPQTEMSDVDPISNSSDSHIYWSLLECMLNLYSGMENNK